MAIRRDRRTKTNDEKNGGPSPTQGKGTCRARQRAAARETYRQLSPINGNGARDVQSTYAAVTALRRAAKRR